MVTETVLLLLLISGPLVTSYPFGAPACVSSPRHGPSPQTSELDIYLEKNLTQQGDARLQLGHPQSDFTFTGFLVRTKAPGEFLVETNSEITARLECSGLLGSAGPDTRAVTHSSASQNNLIQILFQPDLGSELMPDFDIIILKDYSTFWTDISV